jgi:hypothetical protein
MGWLVLNVVYAIRQFDALHGELSDSMVLVQLFQAWYVVDALWNESAILTTMDITTDGLGWMLGFGNTVWVPFAYSIQAKYLSTAQRSVELGPFNIIVIVLIHMAGYWIFRGANGEKNTFKNNPMDESVRDLKFIKTRSGSKLLITGWWGVARHINYTGDWIMGLAWCLPCGFASPIPYFYALYFAILLVHRDARDEHKCSDKYEHDWFKYRQIVRYRMIPFVY